MARDKQIGGIMETKLKALSAKAIIDNARERFVDIEQYIESQIEFVKEQHQSIEDAEN